MPQATLSEIVSTALRGAEAGVKVASLRDAPIEDRGMARVDAYLERELGQARVHEPQKVASAESTKVAVLRSAFDDVRFAHKLAEALEHGAHVVQKLAISGPLNKSTGGPPHSSSLPYSDPAVLKQPFENARVVTPRPQASARAQADAQGRASHNGEPATDEHRFINEGPVIPENYPNGRNITNHQNSKHASSRGDVERLLRSKVAQHRMLVSLGQVEAADAVLKEAQELANSKSLTTSNGSTAVFTDDNYNRATVMPDNEGVRNLTKAQARNANQREAGAFFGEPVKKDNAVKAHSFSTHGLKLSQMKIARGRDRGETPGLHEAAADYQSAVRANIPLQTITSGLGGGILGGMAGHAIGNGHGGATALGAGLGAAGFGALGYHGAKGEQAFRKRLAEKNAHAMLRKIARRGHGRDDHTPGLHEAAANYQSAARANVPLQAGVGGVAGALLGGAIGHDMGGTPGAILGAGAGGLGLGALGYYGAKGEQKFRQRLAGGDKRASYFPKGEPASMNRQGDGAGKTAGFSDLAAGIGRGVSRIAQGGLGKLDEGAQLMRKGTMGPHPQGSMFSRAAERVGGASEGTHKALGYGAMGLGAGGVGYAGYKAVGGGQR